MHSAVILSGKPRKKLPRQFCPVPGCKNPAAPVFGMVCAEHKNVSKAKIKKYREARRAAKLGSKAARPRRAKSAKKRPAVARKPKKSASRTTKKKVPKKAVARRKTPKKTRPAAPTKVTQPPATPAAPPPAAA